MFDLCRQPAGSRVWCRILDEHHLRSPGKLVVRNLDRIAHIDNIRNQRPCKTVQLLAPTMVSENWCERRHLRLTLSPVPAVVISLLVQAGDEQVPLAGYHLKFRCAIY
jgi:hypothetical protein